MTTRHLRHLSSAQALADLARFVPFFKDMVSRSVGRSIIWMHVESARACVCV
jgi:hypothetical protein